MLYTEKRGNRANRKEYAVIANLAHTLYFAGRFLRRPASIGAILPSSRGLRDRMFNGLTLGASDPVLEFGPGTGAFTREIQRRHDAGTAVPYLGIERDRGMYEHLVRQFPSLTFVHADAGDIIDVCRQHGFPPAAAIISGLPLVLMTEPERRSILTAMQQCMRPGAAFRQFSYLHCYPTRRAKRMRASLDAHFADCRATGLVIANVPPAVVLEGYAPEVAPAAA